MSDKAVTYPEAAPPSGIEYRPYKRGALLRMEGPHGTFSYWRYLGYWKPTDQIFMLSVTPGERPTGSRLPQDWKRSELKGRFGVDIYEIPDIVRYDYMDVHLEKLSEEHAQRIRSRITERVAPLRNLVSDDNFMAVIADETARKALLVQAAKESRKHVQTLRKDLTTYWWFGCNDTGMMPLKGGGKGKKRCNFGREKTGRRPAAYLESGAKIDLGVAMNPALYARMSRAVDKYVIEEDLSSNEAFAKYVEYDCIASTKVNGEVVEAPWDRRRAGSLHQFRRVRRERLRELRKLQEKVGESDTENEFTARSGHATDLIGHSKQILILDGTGLPVYLVNDNMTPIGRATGLFGVCLASGALVGQHIWPNTESADAYRYCIFNAMSDKTKLAQEHGLVSAAGLPRGDWDAIFIDRGPAISERFKENIVVSLGMSREMARAYCGRAKGTIESFIAYLKTELRIFPGAYTRRLRTRDKEKRKQAEGKALLTLRELRLVCLLATEKLNLKSDALKYYTAEMRQAKKPEVLPNRTEILGYIQRKRNGDAAPNWKQDELLLRLLPFIERANKEGFIEINSAFYTCNTLQKIWAPIMKSNGAKENPKVSVCPLPGTTNMIVWRKSDGSIEYPRICDRDYARYGNLTVQEQKLVARPTDIAKSARSQRKRSGNEPVRKEVLDRMKGQAKRRQGERLPIAATTGLRENKKQAIAESDEALGKHIVRILSPSAPEESISELLDPLAGQHYDDSDDNSDLFNANFDA